MEKGTWSVIWAYVVTLSATIFFAWLISDWAADRGMFEYQGAPNNERQRATDKYCESIERALLDHLRRFSGGKQDEPEPNKSAYDSCQQWHAADAAIRSANWTGWQAAAAWFSLPVILAAFFAAWWAAVHTKKAARHAAEQAIAARRTLRHTARQANMAERAFADLERPYVFAEIAGTFEGPHQVPWPGEGSETKMFNRPNIGLHFKNWGRVPAVLTGLSLDFEILTNLPQQVRHIPNINLNPFTVISPGVAPETNFAFAVLRNLSDSEKEGIANGLASIWFYGLLTYRSPDGREFVTEFCWQYRVFGETKIFAPHDRRLNRMT
jgi:hypothetical protein